MAPDGPSSCQSRERERCVLLHTRWQRQRQMSGKSLPWSQMCSSYARQCTSTHMHCGKRLNEKKTSGKLLQHMGTKKV